MENNSKPSNTNPSKSMSDIELVVISTKKLESRITKQLGASEYTTDRKKATFYDKQREVEDLFDSQDIEIFKYVSGVRNIIVHDANENTLRDRNRFENAVKSLNKAIDKAIARQKEEIEARREELEADIAPVGMPPKSGCFIATAVYGSYDADEVMKLRRYRDNNLMQTSFGRLFIKSYYTVSPPVADFLREHKKLAGWVKMVLDRIVSKL